MRLAGAALALGAALTSVPALAVDTYSSSQFHRVVAQALIPDRNAESLYFAVVAGVFWTPEVDKTAAGDGIFYQFAGTLDLDVGGRRTMLEPGDGLFIPAGAKFALRSHGTQRPPSFLHFLLSPAALSNAVADPDGASVELYRSPNPVPGLASERNLLSLTRVPVPPQSPPDQLHRRSGAALHYVLSGVGAEFGEGHAAARGPGSISYEPAGYAYQWSNPGLNPLIYLVFNVNAKEEEPVIGLEQQPADAFSRDPHLTLALYCVAISMILAVMVSSATMADYYRERRDRSDRDKR